MKSNRRSFIRLSALAWPFAGVNQLFAQSKAVNKPIVVSTWDSGRISNGGAWPVLEKGGRALDAVEQAAIAMENEINCCVGLGGNPDRDGHVTLDACIMDEKMNCGSVAFVERVKHPASLARKVMENTPHVYLMGEGAQQFAVSSGMKLESGKLSADAENEYKKWLKKGEYKPVINIEHRQSKEKGHGPFAPTFLDNGALNHDTMGTIAMDSKGDMSGMCTTSGMAFKMRGRVGDSPMIGAGLYVDNEVGASTCSGQGEEVIRVCGTHTVVELMRQGLSPEEACKKTVERIIRINPEKAKTFQVGFIAINKNGEVGAYSVQKGFNYTVTDGKGETRVIDAKSHFA